MSSTIVVIPTVEPTEAFVDYVKELIKRDVGVIVIDDGFYDVYKELYAAIEEAGALLLRHGINLGKGRALKTAFNYILVKMPECETVVTADSDGSYLVDDVIRVSELARENTIVLGSRDFDQLPAKNRRANVLTHYVIKWLSGISMSDTQTGLRAYKRSLLPYLLSTAGERYDYDFNMIFEKKEIRLLEVPIKALPRRSSKKTHFRPLKDSSIIITAFLIFIFVSLSATILDLFLYNLMIETLIDVLPIFYVAVSTFIARVVSDTYNYYLDKKLVFKADETAHFGRYVLLALMKTTASAIIVSCFVWIVGDGELWFKMLVDMAIFFVGYRFEKSWVYAK